ncbi:MAG: hypothetical protein GXO36_07410 [Chloroflexi bacterium]|nr:hypothetical protein [Chloroflexota bacterium]
MSVRPLRLDVVAPVLIVFRHCRHCEAFLRHTDVEVMYRIYEEDFNAYPEPWKTEYEHLRQWVRAFQAFYGPWVRLRWIDVQSPLGLWKRLRYRLRPLPGFLVEDGARFCGWDAEPALHQHLSQLLRARGWPREGTPPTRLLPFDGTPRMASTLEAAQLRRRR